jgi:RepB DNA-primase N-terminal domain/RepB DNA-primase C-terminal helical domain
LNCKMGSMFDRGLTLTWHAVRRQLAAMPHDLYLVRLIHGVTKRPYPGERLWTPAQLMSLATLRFLRVRNREGCDVYIQPYHPDRNAGYILIDLDHAEPTVLPHMLAHGHEPCVVLQTSPGHLQAWVHVSATPLQPAVATAIGQQLARPYGGDRASADWRHLGRLAGFTNQKPARRAPGGAAPWVKIVHDRVGLACRADSLLRAVAGQTAPQAHDSLPDVRSLRAAAVQGSDPVEIAAAQASQIYQTWMRRWRIAQRFPQPDWSIVDLWVARALLAQGASPAQVQAILRSGSPQFPRGHGDSDDYLRRTVARARPAFPAPGRAVCPAHAEALAPAAAPAKDSSNSAGGR